MMHTFFEKKHKQEQAAQLMTGLAGIAIGATAGYVFSQKENRKKLKDALNTASRKTTSVMQAVKKELHEDIKDGLEKKEILKEEEK